MPSINKAYTHPAKNITHKINNSVAQNGQLTGHWLCYHPGAIELALRAE